MTKIILVIIFLLIPAIAGAEIKITKWNESVNLTATGKRSEIILNVKAVNLVRSYYHDSFDFIFDSKRKVKIINVKFNNRTAKYTFDSNRLKINFNQRQFNNDDFTVVFIYEEAYNKIHPYLRKEAISVPKWAAGADANVSISFPWSFESATLNPNVKRVGNKFTYSGVVAKGGIFEVIKLTPSRNIWAVSENETISGNKSLGNIQAYIPVYFKNGGFRYENYKVTSKPNAKYHHVRNDKVSFQYVDLVENKINIESRVIIYTGKLYRLNIDRKAADYLQVDRSDKILLTKMLREIKDDPKLKDFPLYAKIGRFVNNFIKYDDSFVGKRIDTQRIITGKTGVCVEYAKLYNALARIAGIPAVIVSGAAHGEYDKFEAHSWNLIYNNNKWFYVDPTWDLMSGVVSSSHIYFYDDGIKAISIKAPAKRNDIKLEGEFTITKVW